MDLTPNNLEYLHGLRFAAQRRLPIGGAGRAQRRIDRLLEMLGGLRVLHVGCCDQASLIRDKLQQGTYLYDRLCRVAARCVGVDHDAEGVALLRDLGFADTYLPEALPAPDADAPHEICLVADALEYAPNPAAYLVGLRPLGFRHLVVVVPNALRWRNSLPGPEVANTAQRMWFTPYTLCKVLVDAGYRPERVELCHGDYTHWRGWLAARALDDFPRWRDTLIVHAKPQP